MSERLEGDITIVGGGIAGLWSAKELLGRGYTVNVVERAGKLAVGATTRNEGWLHAGTYHSVGVLDVDDAAKITERTVFGHDAMVDFAPESIEHATSYALIGSDELAEVAISRWNEFGVEYAEVGPYIAAQEGIDTSRVRAAFAVKDKSVNSRVVCYKLANYVREHGGRILTNTQFTPRGIGRAEIRQNNEAPKAVESDCFLITAGAGIKDIFEQITGQDFPMRFFKAHLLVFPRLTADNFFYIDEGEAGIMNHGSASVVGINRDGIEQMQADYSVVPEKEALIYRAAQRLFPAVSTHNRAEVDFVGVACVKPDIFGVLADVQNLNVKIFEPSPGYVCALPGKMTEAPFLAKAVGDFMSDRITPGGRLITLDVQLDCYGVNPRPADTWMERRFGGTAMEGVTTILSE